MESSSIHVNNLFSPDSMRILHNVTVNIDTLCRIEFKKNETENLSLLFASNFFGLLAELCDTNANTNTKISQKILRFSSQISRKAVSNWIDSLPELRKEIVSYFNSNFKEISVFGDNDLFAKFRFYRYLQAKDDLPQWFGEWGINDYANQLLKSIQLTISSLVNRCECQLLFPKNPSNESSARALLLNNLFKNANDLFLFSGFIQIKPKIDSLWLQPYFKEGFYRYSYLNLTKNPDAPRVHIPENMTAVMHKIRTALKDALWIEEPSDQIGYIFQDENTTISHSDSLLISSAIIEFKKKYSHLRVKKERSDTTMQIAKQLKHIDSLVENEILKIKFNISKELFMYLDSIPHKYLTTLIDASEYQDIFSSNIYWSAFKNLREQLIVRNSFNNMIPLGISDSLKIFFNVQKEAKPISILFFIRVCNSFLLNITTCSCLYLVNTSITITLETANPLKKQYTYKGV